MARKGGGRKSRSNGILATATVSGGVSGIVAMALAVWTILSWYDMECSFDDTNCTFPMSSKDKEDETYYMNVKFIMAWFVAGPAFIAILLGLIAALM